MPQFGIVTGEHVAKLYDQASGVEGWTAEINPKDPTQFLLTPPPGWIVVYDETGRPSLVHAPKHIGVFIAKVNDNPTPKEKP